MHGRLKVRTSEEEKERKKKEQLLKVKAYKHAMGKIQDKRQKAEFDDEMLQLTTVILMRNPDISTLWNIRRECVLHLRDLLDKSAANDEKKEVGEEEEEAAEKATTTIDPVIKLYDVELNLTEQCLVVNPKSYCAWHHRCWTLEHSPEPNWQREVQLCNKYLKLDERNFHTWDYRRYVVAKAGVPKEQELDFCTEKIKVNFSNYSSWHHRSLLLPHLYPYEGDDSLPKRPMSETKLQEELEMVLTAAFTDPNDSSAWFYQRWLLSCSRPDLNVCAFRCNDQKAVLAFTKPVAIDSINIRFHCEDDNSTAALTNWKPVDTTNAADNLATTWLAASPVGVVVDKWIYHLEVDIPNVGVQKLPLTNLEGSYVFYFNAPNPAMAFTETVLVELRNQLESCKSLLEYEPDSKWTLLTTALLMHAIDKEQYHDEMLQFLHKLESVDALRKGYYRDLASKWILEKALCEWSISKKIPMTLNLTEYKQLTRVYYLQYFCIADNAGLPIELCEDKDILNILTTFPQLEL